MFSINKKNTVKRINYFADYKAQWTLKDQKRLVSIDKLFSRSLEFHNNIHSFRTTDAVEEMLRLTREVEAKTGGKEGVDLEASIVLEVTYFDARSAVQTVRVAYHEVTKVLQDLRAYANRGMLWIHIKDIRALPLLSKVDYLHMHQICLTGFYDLRAHSTILPTVDGSFLLTLCTYRLDGDDTRMFKTYVYKHSVRPDEYGAAAGGDDWDDSDDDEDKDGDGEGHGGEEGGRRHRGHRGAHSRVVITYEHELMPDLDLELELADTEEIEDDFEYQRGSTQNPIAKAGPHGDRKPSKSRDDRTSLEQIPSIDVIRILQRRLCDMDTNQLVRTGAMQLIYEMAMEMLMSQDALIEYFSRAMFYFKQKVHIHLLHEEKLIIHRKMHIITSAMLIMSSNITESASCFMRLLDPPPALRKIIVNKRENGANRGTGATDLKRRAGKGASKQTAHIPHTSSTTNAALYGDGGGAGHASIHSPAGFMGHDSGAGVGLNSMPHRNLFLLSDDHIPYIYHLMDAYDFSKQCISNSIEAARGLHQTMDVVAQLRTDHTATTLSLIATVFLPLTFLAGVFGMNFQIDGGYTMTLLNESYGPLSFYMMCIFTFLLCVAYFIKQGWTSPIYLPKSWRRMFKCCIPHNSILSDKQFGGMPVGPPPGAPDSAVPASPGRASRSSAHAHFNDDDDESTNYKPFDGPQPHTQRPPASCTPGRNARRRSTTTAGVVFAASEEEEAEVEEQRRAEAAKTRRSLVAMGRQERASIVRNVAGTRGSISTLHSMLSTDNGAGAASTEGGDVDDENSPKRSFAMRKVPGLANEQEGQL